MSQQFGENLKTLRRSKGMSQEILAQKLYVVRQTVSKWEQGLSVPDAEMLIKIANLFEVPVSNLLGTKIDNDDRINEIEKQLTLLHSYLAKKNEKKNKIMKIVLITGSLLLFCLIVILYLTFLI